MTVRSSDPPGERERLAELQAYEILDTLPEESFDRLTRLAASLLGSPIALVSLVDNDRQWCKSRVGFPLTETPRDISFCTWTIQSDEPLVVEDAAIDPRFARNPLVTGEPRIRFYAGMPLKVPSGHRLGTLCVIDGQPRRLDEHERRLLKDLAAVAIDELELRRALVEAREARAAAEAAAETAAQARSQFLAMISHEIRTPLTGILGFAEFLATAELPDAQRAQAAMIEANGRGLLAVLNDIIDFTRLETGRMRLESVSFDLRELLAGAMTAIETLAADRLLAFRLDLSADLPRLVQGDPGRLRQILRNLLSNAVKFTEQGHVALRARADRPDGRSVRLRVEVEDTGIGMDAAQQGHLFQPFFQADASITRRHGGTGLGLAVCRQLVELMDGTIGVTSRPRIGSVFSFEVPLTLAVAEAPAGRASSPSSAKPRAGRVLVVDDVPTNRLLLQAQLKAEGQDVVLAASGGEAIQASGAQPFDLILMDVHMPVLDGFATARAIRAAGGPNAGTPIVAVTADILPATVAACSTAGMVGHMAKPIERQRLRAVLATHLGPAAA